MESENESQETDQAITGMRISIIIPVYKVEQTLNKCLESVLRQQVADMEVILVDDGSPDTCPELCDEWAARDQKIKVIHQQNGGLSAARNTGIEMAQGDYIAFIDSDDFLEDHTLAHLVCLCIEHPEYDIVEYPAVLFDGSRQQTILSFADMVYTNAISYWNETRAYSHTYAWNKVYKKRLFQNIRFPEGKLFEDVYTFPSLLQASNVIATCSQGLYHYCYNDQSITSTAKAREWRMLLDAHIRICNNPFFQPLSDDYSKHLLNIQIYTNELTGDKPVIPKLEFKVSNSLKITLYRLLGINLLCKANRIFRKIVRRR